MEPRMLDPWYPTEGILYVKECSNCPSVDQGNTVDELELAMSNHICETE